MMNRHRTDFVELLFGLVFVAAGAGFVVHQTTDTTFDAAWIAAIALVTVGVAFLSVTLSNRPGPAPLAATANDTIPHDTIPNDTIRNDPHVDDDTAVPPEPEADPES